MKAKMQTWGLLFAFSMLAAHMAFAQATNSADVTGTVTDPTGAVLPGVFGQTMLMRPTHRS